jgi:hypothetical protein
MHVRSAVVRLLRAYFLAAWIIGEGQSSKFKPDPELELRHLCATDFGVHSAAQREICNESNSSSAGSVLVVLLTSSNIIGLHNCFISASNQRNAPFESEVHIIVNTLNETYFELVKRQFGHQSTVVRTESNGSPGKGHTSILRYFKSQPRFEYLVTVDGDDLLYPSALYRIGHYLQYKPDVLFLTYQDTLTYKSSLERAPHLPVGPHSMLVYNFDKVEPL